MGVSAISLSIGVVIRTFNEEKWVGAVLDRVAAQTRESKVVVVDSGSTDRTLEEVGRRPVKLVQMAPGSFTYGRSLNEGFGPTDADIVVALSAHALPVDERWLERLVDPFSDDAVAATYGRQMPHARLDPFRARDITDYWTAERRLDRDGTTKYSNANGAVRRQRWEEERFDETLGYAEDREWANQVLARGYRVEYVPGAAVYHSHSEGPVRTFRRHRSEARVLGDAREVTLGDAASDVVRRVIQDARCIAKHPRQWIWAPASPVIRGAQVFGARAGKMAAARERARAVDSRTGV